MEFPDWAALPGTQLPDGYEVEELLEAKSNSATFRIRILGDRFTSARGEFFGPGGVLIEQVEMWIAATGLAHTNISKPLTAGVCAGLAYYIEVQPDETLDAVILERALTPEEALQVTRALAEGLSFLHANGYAQASLAASSVAAIGDRICLRLQGVRQLNGPLHAGEDASAAGDVKRLGETVFEVLEQRKHASEEEARHLPAPFDSIVTRCIDSNPRTRCTLPDVLAMLNGSAPISVMATAVTPVVVEVPVAEVPVPVPEVPLIPEEQPITQRGAYSEAYRAGGAEEHRKRSPRWTALLIGIAAILFVVALFGILRHRQPEKPTATVPPSTAWPSHEVKPAPSSTTAAGRGNAAIAPGSSAAQVAKRGGEVWHVIAFTFRREADAEKRARSINEKYSNLHAQVFTPSGGPPYLVALGGRMSREEAEVMRRKARAEGLPRDTYVQNYTR